MDEEARPSDQVDPSQAAARARERARGLFDRIAPVLRDVSTASEQHPVLRETRDAIVERAGEVVRRADDALGRFSAIEGTVVDDTSSASRPAAQPVSDADAARGGAAAAEPAASVAPDGVGTAPSSGRQPHFTRERVARMARAAAVEAVRPARPTMLATRTRIGVVAAAVLLLALVLRWRRR